MGKNIRHYNITNYLNSTFKVVCATAILYLIFAKLTKMLFVSQVHLLPFFPAIGFAVAFTIIFGRKAIFGVVIGSLLFSLDIYRQELFYPENHQVFINTLTVCIVRPVIAVINVFFVSHFTILWCKTKYPFSKGTYILKFSVATLLGSIIAPTVGVFFIAVFSNLSNSDLQIFWSNLTRGNVLGIILFTPFVLSWLYNSQQKEHWSVLKKMEAFSLPFIALAASIYVFVTNANNESVLYLLLIWAGYRFNVKLITMLTLIIAVVSTYYTGHRMGGFAFSSWEDNFFLLQLFLFVNMVSILFFKAILKEKEAEENKLKISEQVLSTERNILKATIESTNTTSIFSLDTNLNYLNFNSSHERFMKDIHGTSIKIGDNHMALISFENKKEEFFSIFQRVLKGNNYDKEEKGIDGGYWKISKSPIRDNDENIIGISVIITDISDLKLKEIQLKENNISLNERIKELSCLYDITKILNRKSLSNSEKLQACARNIPTSFQFPENANCRIQFNEEEFFSDNYRKNNIHIFQKIVIKGVECGCIEAGYFDEKLNNENIFLEEESKLLETLSDIISKALETKIAEENLKESEKNYRTLFENVQDVFFKTSIKTRTILDVSPSCSQFNDITREELIGQNMFSIYSDENEGQMIFEKLLKEDKITDHNNKILIKGKIFHVSINAEISYNDSGEPEYAVGSMRDISQRRVAEENLKISEEKFRSIYESFEDVYFKKTLDGLLLDVSPSAEKYFNMKREVIIGMNAYDFYVDRVEGEHFYQSVLKNRQVHDYEERFLNANGEIIYFSVSAKLVNDSDGKPAYFEGTMRDITERIQNREKLQEGADKIKESEEKFRSIFENMQDIYYRHNFDGEITEMSPSCEKHFKRKREEMIGTYTKDLYYDTSKQIEFREKIIKDGFINDEQVQFITATGEPIYFSINCKIIRNKEGIPSHIEGSMRNINDRILSQKQLLEANEKIKESEKRYRNIFENARDVFFVGSIKEDVLLDISPSCSYFGVQPEDIIGKSIEEFYFEPKDRIEVLKARDKHGEIKDYVVRYVFNGKPYYVSLNSRITYDQNNEPEFLIGSFTDVTDRIEAEENLKISEAKFRSIYENFEDVYFKTALDGTFVELSPSFEKHFLKPCAQTIGSSGLDMYYNKEDRNLLLEKLKTENHIFDFDTQFIDANGNMQYFSMNAHFLYEDGIPTYIEGTLRNVNDRLAVQKEMAAKNRILEFQNTELEQFAYIASHDLQEPLITVIHCIQMLEEEMGENLDEDQKQYLEFINSSTSRMQLLVKGLLDYSRIGKERKSTQIDCNEIIVDVLADMDASLKESGAVVEYDNLPVIKGNATEMRQLFQNLISNANKFRKKGQSPKINIAAVKEENNWLFSVKDNGIGIEEHEMDKVFIIFKRLHNRHEYQGTGIGLSHCKKIIEQHKGKIWVESKFDEGSTFKWTFPIE